MIHLNIGSNLNSIYGTRFDNISIAIDLLSKSRIKIIKVSSKLRNGIPYGIRTRVAAVKGRCPKPLDERDVSGLFCYLSKLIW